MNRSKYLETAVIFGYLFSLQSLMCGAGLYKHDVLDLDQIGAKAYYGDVCGDMVVYSVGPACDYTWDIKFQDTTTGHSGSFYGVEGTTIDNQPKIDDVVVVWCGGPKWKKPWTHEPSNFSIFARNLRSKVQVTLREYTMSESYSHPAISGSKVVWIEHLELDPSPKGRKGKNWWNTFFNICGADITDIESPKYFTIANNVGKRDPYACLKYWKSFDNVIDICGDTVVWEADGDIFGADISDTSNIEVFTICDDPSAQYDPVISEETVLWTDQRNDQGDIYGASILDMKDVRPRAVVREPGTQKQPALDGEILVYVSRLNDAYEGDGEIKARRLKEFPKTDTIGLNQRYTGQRPAVNGCTIIWKGTDQRTDRKPQGIRLHIPEVPKKIVRSEDCAM